jgi:hypothetical protein
LYQCLTFGLSGLGNVSGNKRDGAALAAQIGKNWSPAIAPRKPAGESGAASGDMAADPK